MTCNLFFLFIYIYAILSDMSAVNTGQARIIKKILIVLELLLKRNLIELFCFQTIFLCLVLLDVKNFDFPQLTGFCFSKYLLLLEPRSLSLYP